MDLRPRPVGRPRSCSCGECRKCRRADYMREWSRHKTPEQRRAWVALRDPERVRVQDRTRSRTAKKREALERSVARHPERHAARVAVHKALKRGEMHRQPCGVCGTAKAEAHHPDYSKPLDVVWLCRRHHTDIHMGAKAA